MILCSEHYIPMPDGVRLYTRILTPDVPSPVVFMRSPYYSATLTIEDFRKIEMHWAEAGYAVVCQDCRGTERSEGEMIPYLNERKDGLALLEWVRKQPFYNGEIYLTGGSYCCSVHLSWLAECPPDVKGAVLLVQDQNRYNVLYRNGFYKCGLHGSWFIGQYAKKRILKKNFTEDSFRTLPLSQMEQAVFNEPCPVFREELRHPWPEDPFWKTPAGGSEYRDAISHLKIPLLLITAFHDIYTEGMFRMWDDLLPETRAMSAMIVTPYSHDPNKGVFPYPGGSLSEAAPNILTEWFDSIRKGTPPGFPEKGKIRWYSMFENRWISAPFLKNGAVETKLYLNRDTLSPEPGPSEKLTYCYNPFAPSRFNGGCCNNFGGQQVQDPPNSRYDILSFLSAPAEEDLRFRGTGEVLLTVTSDAPDTCFYARLSIVHGKQALGTRDDIVSVLRQVPGFRPGDKVQLKLAFAENSFQLCRGDSLRLDISSSCWPHFVPHTNRAGLFSEQTGADIARNTIFLGESSLTLHREP